jgi:uncharacterized protein (DUF58 family)
MIGRLFRRFLYYDLRRLFGIRYAVSRQLTRGGKFAVGCFILAIAFGADTRATTAFQAFVFLGAVFALSSLWVIVQTRFPVRFTAFRFLPRHATAGTPVTYRLLLRFESKRTMRSLTAIEDLEDPRPTFEEYTAPSARRPRNVSEWLDNLIGYSRWWNTIARRRIVEIDDQKLPDIPPRGEAELRITVTPTRRGRVHFTGVTVGRPDLFGLMRNLHAEPLPQSMLVLPKRYHLPRLPLPGTRQYQPHGVSLASAVGQSDEFVALRDYRPGDALRQIHWKSVAKTDRLIVRENEDEYFVRHALILDTFAVAEQDAVFEEAVAVAASFVVTLQTQESLLDLLLVGNDAYCFTAGRGVGHVDHMLEVLAGVDMSAGTNFSKLESLVIRHAPLVSGCVCVFMSWDAPRQRLVEILQSLGVPLRVCVVTDEKTAETLTAGPMARMPGQFHVLPVGKVQEALLRC